MALSANTVWEIRTGGSDTNGGGFVTGASGVDYSQQNSAQYALTNVTTAAANAILLSASAAADMVGNILYIASGTNFTVGFYQVTAVSVGVSITVDRTCTSAAGALGVVNVGGALATPGQLAANLITVGIDGMNAWMKVGTYTLTGATPNVSGGPVDASAATITGIRFQLEGYSVTRGDRAGRPELNAGTQTSLTLWKIGATDRQRFVHLAANGNSKTGVNGFSANATRGGVFDCLASNCDQTGTTGFALVGISMLAKCKASACLIGFTVSAGAPVDCWADGCGTGFSTSIPGVSFTSCLASDSTGKGFLSTNVAGAYFYNCTADGNAGDGFDMAAGSGYAVACVSANNGGYGFNTATQVILENCASYNNTSGRVNAAVLDEGSIVLSADPWVNGASDDYRPNNTAGGGAAIRGVASGIAGQTNNRDVGAVQHSDPSSSVAANPLAGFVT